jgi:hypothetical protein
MSALVWSIHEPGLLALGVAPATALRASTQQPIALRHAFLYTHEIIAWVVRLLAGKFGQEIRLTRQPAIFDEIDMNASPGRRDGGFWLPHAPFFAHGVFSAAIYPRRQHRDPSFPAGSPGGFSSRPVPRASGHAGRGLHLQPTGSGEESLIGFSTNWLPHFCAHLLAISLATIFRMNTSMKNDP